MIMHVFADTANDTQAPFWSMRVLGYAMLDCPNPPYFVNVQVADEIPVLLWVLR